jgi:hypothetical protein
LLLNQATTIIVSEGKGRLFPRKDNKNIVYLSKDLAESTYFLLKASDTITVKVSLGDNKGLIQKWNSPNLYEN